jgi:tRNA threonylcarbamoyladenosine biosynthesis protein TsaE
MKKYLSKSLAETQKIAEDFIKKIAGQKSDRATVVGLFGDLGSGKTTFAQAIGQCLGVEAVMTSPTFVIMKKYSLRSDISNLTPNTLIHIDAYRLDSGQELLNLNLTEDLANPQNLILIEWPERIEGVLPKNLIRINFKFVSETQREIEL